MAISNPLFQISHFLQSMFSRLCYHFLPPKWIHSFLHFFSYLLIYVELQYTFIWLRFLHTDNLIIYDAMLKLNIVLSWSFNWFKILVSIWQWYFSYKFDIFMNKFINLSWDSQEWRRGKILVDTVCSWWGSMFIIVVLFIWFEVDLDVFLVGNG